MEWNWNVTPSLLFESSGDSEELLKPTSGGLHNHQEEQQEADMDESHQGHDDDVDVDDDDDDDAESCSYDHTSYVNTRYCGVSNQDQTGFITYDDDDGHDDDDDDDDDGKVDDEKMNMSHQFCHQLCGDSCSHERENDRKFWETCLAS